MHWKVCMKCKSCYSPKNLMSALLYYTLMNFGASWWSWGKQKTEVCGCCSHAVKYIPTIPVCMPLHTSITCTHMATTTCNRYLQNVMSLETITSSQMLPDNHTLRMFWSMYQSWGHRPLYLEGMCVHEMKKMVVPYWSAQLSLALHKREERKS